MTTTTSYLTAEEGRAKAAKVRALRNKTTARGCTAEEADAAQLLADKLIVKYGLEPHEYEPEPERRSTFGSWFEDMMRQEAARHTEYARQEAKKAQQQQAPKAPTGKRQNRSHAACAHESTPAARARCRKAGGPQ